MNNYDLDKSRDNHKYSDVYATLLDPIRNQVRNMLEVGINYGASLHPHPIPRPHPTPTVSLALTPPPPYP